MIPLLIAVGVACFAAGVCVGSYCMMNVMDDRHLAELERMSNMLNAGTPIAPEAEIVSQQPDAIARVRSKVHEDSVSNLATDIKQRYSDRGLALSEEEARIQAEAILMGKPPV